MLVSANENRSCLGSYPTPGGATATPVCPDVCVQKLRTWVLFWPQVSEMSEIVSLKMGVKFASSLIMGEKLAQKLNITICRNAISGHIIYKIQYIYSKERDIE